MRSTIPIKFYFILVLFLNYIFVNGQSLPVGVPVMEDVYRRAQLIDSFNQSVSFTVKPLYPFNIDKKQLSDNTLKKFDKVFFKYLPLLLRQQYNSNNPEGLNNGTMIPAKGYQTLFSGGIYANYRWLSVQLMPEFVFAENRNYLGFPDELSNDQWNVYYYGIQRKIDIPERFGKTSYKKFFWGQSSIRLTYNPISIGISNENLWWGPGMQNALLMTNNAPGFKHFTLNTVRPIRTFIGSFEGQLVGGRLESSGFPNIDSTSLAQHNTTYTAKPKDWRYLSGLILSYQPKWLPGLFLGAARSYIVYHQDIEGNIIDDYFPMLSTDVFKKLTGIYNDSKDELASVFLRWIVPESHLEAYLEYGREDRMLDATDLLLEFDFSNAYILGFRKLTQMNKNKDEFIDIQAEITQLQRNYISTKRTPIPASWYIHHIVFDGYTHNGQYLGAGIGTSSNMQSLNISWIKNIKKLGMEFKRVAHEEDFWYSVSHDPKSHWIDIGGALIGEWDYKQFLISTKIQLVGSQNYQYLYSPGKITYNLHTELGITYLFK